MSGFDLAGSVQAGQGLLAPIAELMRKNEQDQQDGAQADALVSWAVQNGAMSPEEHQQYINAPLQKKKGIVGALTINWARSQQAKQDQFRQQQLDQQMQIARMPYDYAPSDEDMARARATGGELLPSGRGQYHFAPYPDSGSTGPIEVDAFKDPITKQPVPGMGIVRKTGQIGYFGALLGAGGGVPIETDPKTGMQFYRDAKGNPKPLDPTKVMQSQLTQPEQPTAPAATPAPRAPQPTAAMTPQDMQALAWAQANPNDPRSAAILKKLGIR